MMGETAGRFVPGSVPNPNGKKPGTRNRATTLLDQMAERGGKAVLAAVLEAAKSGDTAAANLVLARIWPPRRGRPLRFELPDLAQPGGAPAALAAIARSTAEGAFSPEEAGEIVKVVESYQRATDVAELLNRIERLEAAIAATARFTVYSVDATGATIRPNGSASG